MAAYAQDRWTASSKITITAGIRYDYQRPYYDTAKRDPVLTYVFSPVTTQGATLLKRNTVAPRVGLSWNPSDDNKSVIKAFYGRYYFNYADTLAGADPGGANYQDRIFNDLNGNRILDGPQELGAIVSSFGGTSTTVDPNLKTPFSDEFDLSYDRQFWGEAAFRVAYVRKMVRNLYTTINAPLIGQFNVPYTTTINVTNYSSTGAQVVGQQTLTLNDIPASLKGVSQNVIMNIPDSLGGGKYNYDTVTLAFNKRFGKGLFLNASYDYQWREDLRSAGGGGAPSVSNSPLSSDPIGTVGVGSSGMFFPVNPDVSLLQNTNTWDAHLSARYSFKYDIGVAVNYSGQSGWPYARYVTVNLPNAGSRNVWLEDISNNRSDNIHLLAVRLDKSFTVNKVKMTGMLDLFNALNSNAVTNFNIANGARFNQINATVDPRTFQVGFRVEF
jgi:outer membrane receptor protein involved in Fe transport